MTEIVPMCQCVCNVHSVCQYDCDVHVCQCDFEIVPMSQCDRNVDSVSV